MKIAFLDRDGTLVKDYPDKDWAFVKTPEIMEGTVEGLKVLKELGYQFILITNQYIINEGIISKKQYDSFTEDFVKHLKDHQIDLLDIFYCPHTSAENCGCKKPEIGMFKSAYAKYPAICVEDSIMVGDSNCDEAFAEKIGLTFYGIKGGSIDNQERCYKSIHHVSQVLGGN